MNCPVFVVAILFAIVTHNETRVELPDFAPPCSPKSEKCLKIALENLRPHLKRGIPEFNLDPIEPLHLPDFKQTGNTSSNMNYTSEFERIQYDGASDFTVSKVHVDLDNLKFEMVIVFPTLVFRASDTVSAHWNGTDLTGKGDVEATFENLSASFLLHGAIHSRGEELYLEWKEDVISISFDHANVELDSLFEGRDDIQRIVKHAVQQPEVFVLEYQNLAKNTLALRILYFVNLVHEIFPVNVLYVLD